MTKFGGRHGGCLLNCQQNVGKYSNYFAGESLVFSITFYYLWPKRIMVFSAWTWGSEEVCVERGIQMPEYFVLTANIAVWDTSKQLPSQILRKQSHPPPLAVSYRFPLVDCHLLCRAIPIITLSVQRKLWPFRMEKFSDGFWRQSHSTD